MVIRPDQKHGGIEVHLNAREGDRRRTADVRDDQRPEKVRESLSPLASRMVSLILGDDLNP